MRLEQDLKLLQEYQVSLIIPLRPNAQKIFFNPTLSGFVILKDKITISQNWLIFNVFVEMFDRLNFAEDQK